MKPALTAEEWERHQQPATTDLSGDATEGRWSEIEEANASQAVYMLEGGLYYRPGAIHGVAARLLDKQPFGFTREDVEWVEQAAWDTTTNLSLIASKPCFLLNDRRPLLRMRQHRRDPLLPSCRTPCG